MLLETLNITGEAQRSANSNFYSQFSLASAAAQTCLNAYGIKPGVAFQVDMSSVTAASRRAQEALKSLQKQLNRRQKRRSKMYKLFRRTVLVCAVVAILGGITVVKQQVARVRSRLVDQPIIAVKQAADKITDLALGVDKHRDAAKDEVAVTVAIRRHTNLPASAQLRDHLPGVNDWLSKHVSSTVQLLDEQGSDIIEVKQTFKRAMPNEGTINNFAARLAATERELRNAVKQLEFNRTMGNEGITPAVAEGQKDAANTTAR